MQKAPKLIQSVERSAMILELIAQAGGGARLQHIAEASGLGKTTVHNILQTLMHLGYVQRRAGDIRYYLGGRILNLARVLSDDQSLRARLRPLLEDIARTTQATVWLAVPSGDEASYLDIINLHTPHTITPDLYRREPLEGSAVGLVFLAFVPGLGRRVLARCPPAQQAAQLASIEAVRAQGYALDLAAYHQGIHGVAIPWREQGEVTASICITGPAPDYPAARLVRLSWAMTRLAQKAEVQLR
ncbi:IclR family transcriptional regulator [Acetobacter orientalis]|uniref:Transcriptional regulator n=1 Tax=Acetobacter orientalis TaxID=146474 RepID=A0A251ZZW8_9PROT|nr:IclR family transcriptional regulator [Acetobacter orientalis]OUI80286.1 transcriptional regulator [Acetobacter orientalis]